MTALFWSAKGRRPSGPPNTRRKLLVGFLQFQSLGGGGGAVLFSQRFLVFCSRIFAVSCSLRSFPFSEYHSVPSELLLSWLPLVLQLMGRGRHHKGRCEAGLVMGRTALSPSSATRLLTPLALLANLDVRKTRVQNRTRACRNARVPNMLAFCGLL